MNAIQVLGWTLVHFLWQGVGIAAILAIALPAMRRRSSNARYAAACLALTVLALAPIATAVWLGMPGEMRADQAVVSAVQPSASLAEGVSAAGSAPAAQAADEAGPTMVRQFVGLLTSRLDVVVFAWTFGVFIMSLRLLVGFAAVRRLRRDGVRPASGHLDMIHAHLQKRLGMKRAIELLISARAQVPAVVGWFRPVILLPMSCVMGMPASQLQAVLAHELAHIRRHDHIVHAAQAILETLLFYHPAVWWISGRVEFERENCCDDLAVAMCGSPSTLAIALTKLEDLRSAPSPAMAATGSNLLARIQRLAFGSAVHAGGLRMVAVVLAIVFGLSLTVAYSAFAQKVDPLRPGDAVSGAAGSLADPAPGMAPQPAEPGMGSPMFEGGNSMMGVSGAVPVPSMAPQPADPGMGPLVFEGGNSMMGVPAPPSASTSTEEQYVIRVAWGVVEVEAGEIVQQLKDDGFPARMVDTYEPRTDPREPRRCGVEAGPYSTRREAENRFNYLRTRGYNFNSIQGHPVRKKSLQDRSAESLPKEEVKPPNLKAGFTTPAPPSSAQPLTAANKDSNYMVVVAAGLLSPVADAMIESLKRDGYKNLSRSENRDDKGNLTYQVYAGPFTSQFEADGYATDMRRDGYVTVQVVSEEVLRAKTPLDVLVAIASGEEVAVGDIKVKVRKIGEKKSELVLGSNTEAEERTMEHGKTVEFAGRKLSVSLVQDDKKKNRLLVRIQAKSDSEKIAADLQSKLAEKKKTTGVAADRKTDERALETYAAQLEARVAESEDRLRQSEERIKKLLDELQRNKPGEEGKKENLVPGSNAIRAARIREHQEKINKIIEENLAQARKQKVSVEGAQQYRVQVGEKCTPEQGAEVARELRDKGFGAAQQYTTRDGKSLVFVGMLPVVEAERLERRLAAEGYKARVVPFESIPDVVEYRQFPELPGKDDEGSTGVVPSIRTSIIDDTVEMETSTDGATTITPVSRPEASTETGIPEASLSREARIRQHQARIDQIIEENRKAAEAGAPVAGGASGKLFRVQVGENLTDDEARRLAEQLRDEAFSGVFQVTTADGKGLVYVGRLPEEQAKRLEQQLKQDGYNARVTSAEGGPDIVGLREFPATFGKADEKTTAPVLSLGANSKMVVSGSKMTVETDSAGRKIVKLEGGPGGVARLTRMPSAGAKMTSLTRELATEGELTFRDLQVKVANVTDTGVELRLRIEGQGDWENRTVKAGWTTVIGRYVIKAEDLVPGSKGKATLTIETQDEM